MNDIIRDEENPEIGPIETPKVIPQYLLSTPLSSIEDRNTLLHRAYTPGRTEPKRHEHQPHASPLRHPPASPLRHPPPRQVHHPNHASVSQRITRLFRSSEPIHMIRFDESGAWKFKIYKRCCARGLSAYQEKIQLRSSTLEVHTILSRSASRHLPLLPGELSLRDLQRLDPRLGRSDPCILVKSLAFVIALSDIRALVLPNKAYFVLMDGMDSELDTLRRTFIRALAPLTDDDDDQDDDEDDDDDDDDRVRDRDRDHGHKKRKGHGRRRQDEPHRLFLEPSPQSAAHSYSASSSGDLAASSARIPFELTVLTSILETIMGLDHPPDLHDEQRAYSILGRECGEFQHSAEQLVKSHGTEDLRLVVTQGNRLKRKLATVKGILKDLLESDEDMARMGLSKVLANPLLYLNSAKESWAWDHADVEHILVYYLQCMNRLKSQVQVLNAHLKSERNDYMMRLENSRNRLMRLQVYFIVITAFAALAAIPTGIGGMSEFDALQFTSVFWGVGGMALAIPVIGSVIVLVIAEYRGWLL